MSDNAAAERIVRRIEKEKERAERMKKGTEEGLKALFRDMKKRADLAREIQDARRGGQSNYEAWKQQFDEKYSTDTSDATGYEDKPWDRD